MEHMANRGSRYSRGAMLLHWVIAACFAFQIGLGWRMGAPRGPQTFAVFQLHKSIGITILLLTLVRIAWRLSHRPPPFPAALKQWERALAHGVHIAFYVVLLAMPLTGWLIVSSSKTAIPTLLFGAVPWPHIPGIVGLTPDAKASVNAAGATGHLILAWGALVLIALHVLGALKHQLLERGGELGRMLPLPYRWLSAAALLLVAALVTLMALGRAIPLKPIALAGSPVASVAPIPMPAPAAEPAPAAAPAPAGPPGEASHVATAAAPAEAAKSADWTLRKAKSSLGFQTAWSQGSVVGHFDTWDAVIHFDPDALDKSAVKATIDLASVKTGEQDTEQALPGDDWFAAATHPTATYTATKFRHLAGNRYEATGTLSLRGVTKALPLSFALTIKGDVATMTGSAKIDRTVFGVGQGEWGSTSDVPALVSVTIAIIADRKTQ